MPDYIPSDDSGRIEWLAHFSAWMNGHGTAHGFTPAEVSMFYFTASQARGAVSANVTRQAAARGATVAKNAALAAAVGMARDYAQRLQNHPNTTDQERATAGITVRDINPKPTPSNDINTVPAPLLVLDFSARRQVTIHWGPNPQDEHHNGRPAGTIGCQVQFARGGIPTDENLWTALEIDTESPITHFVTDTTPTTYAYRARYVGKNLKMGSFSDPAVCTVSA